MRIGIVIQCRSGSNRLPRKVYKDLNGKNSIQRILGGMKKTVVATDIILAMPSYDRAEIESRIAAGELDPYIDDRFHLYIHDGDENDLVDRFHKVARKYGLSIIARITGDCPFWCAAPFHLDEGLMEYMKNGSKGIMGNNLLFANAPFSCGIDFEIFNYEMICWTKLHATTKYDKEHCTPLMYSKLSQFPILGFENKRPNTMISTKIPDFSLDTQEDYEFLLKLTKIYDECGDINKALETVDLTGFSKTNLSKSFRQ